MKKYFCDKYKKQCRYAGNKYYNFGFVSGTSGYCRKIKQWTCDVNKCPEEDQV